MWPSASGQDLGTQESYTWSTLWEALLGRKGSLSGVWRLFMEIVQLQVRAGWLGSCSQRTQEEGTHKAYTCCLGLSSAAWLSSLANPPDGPQGAQGCLVATPWPASPLWG